MSQEMGPLRILQLKEGSSEVEILRENLEKIQDNLRKSGADMVSIVAVMGAYRTGKSFLLDLLMRHLRCRCKALKEKEEREAQARARAEAAAAAAAAENGGAVTAHEPSFASAEEELPAEEPAQPAGPPWRLGDEQRPKDAPVPEWIRHGDADRISEGSKTGDEQGGFAWRPGKDKCTQGIWLWSTPFVFTDKAGRKIGVLLMDTQGAWDDTMTKAQSATIFGLTALLSSKLIYNIQNRIEEDKLENLDYITTFAHTVCSEMPGTGAPFGHLELFVRDWANYDDGFTIEECMQQMEEHQDDHMNPKKVPDDAKERVERLASTFQSISSFGLVHPGLKVTKPQFGGEIASIDADFLHLLNVFTENFFGGDFPQPCSPLGMDISVNSFTQMVMNFAEAFRDNAAEMAIGLREAFVKVEMMTAKEDILKRFREHLVKIAPESAVVDPIVLKKDADKILGIYKAEFETKLKPWKLRESEMFTAVNDFTQTVTEAANMRLMQNEQHVEGATVKLAATPVVGCGVYFFLVHQWILMIAAAVGGYCHMKKWSTRNETEMYDPSVFQGIGEDIKRWSQARYKDVQAMTIALNRCNPNEAVETAMKAARQAGAIAATAATNAGLQVPGGAATGPPAGAAGAAGAANSRP